MCWKLAMTCLEVATGDFVHTARTTDVLQKFLRCDSDCDSFGELQSLKASSQLPWQLAIFKRVYSINLNDQHFKSDEIMCQVLLLCRSGKSNEKLICVHEMFTQQNNCWEFRASIPRGNFGNGGELPMALTSLSMSSTSQSEKMGCKRRSHMCVATCNWIKDDEGRGCTRRERS